MAINRRDLLKAVPLITLAGADTAFAGTDPKPELQKPGTFAMTQLGFRVHARKTATLLPPAGGPSLPERIPFYVIPSGWILPRVTPEVYKGAHYTWPFDVTSANWSTTHEQRLSASVYFGELTRHEGRWGAYWRAEFEALVQPGIYQIETERQFSLPFEVGDSIYERVARGFLIYLNSQRAGYAVPGIRPAQNVDDAVLDTDGSYVPTSGGWFDAGDTMKWVSHTAYNFEGLHSAWQCAPAFRTQIIDELEWGNRWLHGMISPEGQVWEDIGGGRLAKNFDYEKDWWVENHAGFGPTERGNSKQITDNIPMSGDERLIRTSYNPWAQFGFVRWEAMTSTILQPTDAVKCRFLAEKAWRYGINRPHDQRTLFVSGQLRAGLELLAAGSSAATPSEIAAVAQTLLARQDLGLEGRGEGLSHYFLEKDAADAYRSIPHSCDPPLALLRLCELKPSGMAELVSAAEAAVRSYIDDYLLADADSNPYGLPPYGVFINPPRPQDEFFRPAGRGRGVRTFLPPFNKDMMVHGTNAVLMTQAHLLARAGKYFGVADYCDHAEKLLQWSMGHNTVGFSTFSGIGYRHPLPYSVYCLKVPEAVMNGFCGRPDDTPYLETGNTIQWNTQEIWGVPYAHAMGALAHLM